MQGAGCRVQGAGCRVQGAGCRVQGHLWGSVRGAGPVGSPPGALGSFSRRVASEPGLTGHVARFRTREAREGVPPEGAPCETLPVRGRDCQSLR